MNLGILGAGRIAHVMADTILQLNASGNHSVTLYGIAARDLQRAQEFSKTYHVAHAYGSYEEMLQSPELDFVYIATPHSHHYQHMKLCIDHRKHVLCEKSFTVNARQAEDILRYAKEKQVLVTEAIWTRYQPMRQIISEVIHSNIIGEPRMLTANLCYTIMDKERIVRPELAGGALLDVGVYTLNFAEMIFGHPQCINGIGIKHETGVDIADSLTLTWNDGKMAVLTTGATTISDRMGIIYGTNGYIVVENINNPQGIQVFDVNRQCIKFIPCPKQLTGYEYEVLEVVNCIKEGRLECPSMPHCETIHMMEVMDHLRAQMGICYPCEDI